MADDVRQRIQAAAESANHNVKIKTLPPSDKEEYVVEDRDNSKKIRGSMIKELLKRKIAVIGLNRETSEIIYVAPVNIVEEELAGKCECCGQETTETVEQIIPGRS